MQLLPNILNQINSKFELIYSYIFLVIQNSPSNLIGHFISIELLLRINIDIESAFKSYDGLS